MHLRLILHHSTYNGTCKMSSMFLFLSMSTRGHLINIVRVLLWSNHGNKKQQAGKGHCEYHRPRIGTLLLKGNAIQREGCPPLRGRYHWRCWVTGLLKITLNILVQIKMFFFSFKIFKSTDPVRISARFTLVLYFIRHHFPIGGVLDMNPTNEIA